MTDATIALKPRKSPVQARSAATIAALHTAAIQVLTRDGLSGCTTTGIAERAGLSVGSLYQYYPNRDALLAAVLENHLTASADAIEQMCRDHTGKPISEMASALVRTYLTVKLHNPQQSKALYAVAGERGGPELVVRMQARTMTAIAALLASAPDVRFDDPATTGAIAFNAMAGPVKALLEGHLSAGIESRLEGQLIRLVTAYLQSHQTQPATAALSEA